LVYGAVKAAAAATPDTGTDSTSRLIMYQDTGVNADSLFIDGKLSVKARLLRAFKAPHQRRRLNLLTTGRFLTIVAASAWAYRHPTAISAVDVE
jgi:hypothetical protein